MNVEPRPSRNRWSLSDACQGGLRELRNAMKCFKSLKTCRLPSNRAKPARRSASRCRSEARPRPSEAFASLSLASGAIREGPALGAVPARRALRCGKGLWGAVGGPWAEVWRAPRGPAARRTCRPGRTRPPTRSRRPMRRTRRPPGSPGFILKARSLGNDSEWPKIDPKSIGNSSKHTLFLT